MLFELKLYPTILSNSRIILFYEKIHEEIFKATVNGTFEILAGFESKELPVSFTNLSFKNN